MEVRTRFAPSPTGFMHVGNLRTGLYAYLYAKQQGGTFILRIEDTDQGRYVEGATDAIFRTLKMAGIDYDEGPGKEKEGVIYVQSQRKALYKKYALELVEKGHAYYCFCQDRHVKDGGVGKYDKHCAHLSKEEVQAHLDNGDSYVIRMRVPETDGVSEYDDMVYGHIAVAYKDMDDMILLKSDGMPTYNFANVIDDHSMNVTHILRGNEYLSSTPQYNLLYDFFGWQRPAYIHLAPIMRDKEHKLSKRYGDANFEDFVAKGYLPQAIVNYIALLGWSPKGNQEKLSMDELKEQFDLSGLSQSPSIFDPLKMRWLNSEYIRALSPEEFAEVARPFYAKSKAYGHYDEGLVFKLLQPRLETLGDIPEMIDFVEEWDGYDLELFVHQKNKTDRALAAKILKATLPVLENTPWDNDSILNALSELAPTLEVKKGAVLWCVRIAIAGRAVTPGGASEMAVLIGKGKSLDRIRTSIERLAD